MVTKTTRKVAAGTALLLAALGLGLIANAQEGPQRQRGGRERPSPEQMQSRMQEFRTRMLDRTRQELGFSEEEWKVISPRFEKVSDLSRQIAGPQMMRRMGGRGFGGRRGGPGGAEGPQRQRPEDQTELAKASQALNDVLENEAATPEQIKTALGAFRTARGKVEKELADARKALRELLNARQEAMLVVRGTLD
jgi:hypothetical protein